MQSGEIRRFSAPHSNRAAYKCRFRASICKLVKQRNKIILKELMLKLLILTEDRMGMNLIQEVIIMAYLLVMFWIEDQLLEWMFIGRQKLLERF